MRDTSVDFEVSLTQPHEKNETKKKQLSKYA
jgi:hypothetical protein